MFPDVIMIAQPNSNGGEQLHGRIPLLAAFEDQLAGDRYRADVLTTHPYKNKTVLTVGSADTDTRTVVKVANVRLPGADIVQESYQNLQRLHSRFISTDPFLAESI